MRISGFRALQGILGVFEARKSRSAPLAFCVFDVLQLAGREVMSEPWTDRRKRLEDLGAGLPASHVPPATTPRSSGTAGRGDPERRLTPAILSRRGGWVDQAVVPDRLR